MSIVYLPTLGCFPPIVIVHVDVLCHVTLFITPTNHVHFNKVCSRSKNLNVVQRHTTTINEAVFIVTNLKKNTSFISKLVLQSKLE